MHPSITLKPYSTETPDALRLIRYFWKVHNDYDQTDTEALGDLDAWTAEGHRFYFICLDDTPVGFVHLGNRGGKPDWIEDLFVEPSHQNQGIGTAAIQEIAEEVRTYSDSLYYRSRRPKPGCDPSLPEAGVQLPEHRNPPPRFRRVRI